MDVNDASNEPRKADRSPDDAGYGAIAPPARSGRARRVWSRIFRGFVALLILTAAGAGFAHLRATKPDVPRQDIPERSWIVKTVVAKSVSVTPKLTLYGTIVAGREAELRPLVSGRVVKVGKSFSEGGIVKKGDTLIEIDRFDYEKAVEERKAMLSEAKSRLVELKADLAGLESLAVQDEIQLKLRQTDYKRRVRLRQSGTGSQKALDDASIALNQQRAQVADRAAKIAGTKARISQQGSVIARLTVALERSERDLAQTKLVAPFDGFLREISTAVGKRVGVGDKVATIVAADSLEAEFQVSDRQYGRLVSNGGVIGKNATVVWKTGGHEFRFSATIERVSARVTANQGGVNLYARIDKVSTKTILRPGVFVDVVIDDRAYEKVFVLPDEAVETLDSKPGAALQLADTSNRRRVYVVQDGRLVTREVDIVGRSGNDVLVRGGIKAGDRIVAETFPEIGPGVKVEAR